MAITHGGKLPEGNNGISIQSLEGAFLRLDRDSDGLLSAADLHGAGAGGVVVVSRVVYHGKKGVSSEGKYGDVGLFAGKNGDFREISWDFRCQYSNVRWDHFVCGKSRFELRKCGQVTAIMVRISDDFTYIKILWLVVWNMAFVFPNSWDDDPIWLIFSGG